jgi:hypothetical protein
MFRELRSRWQRSACILFAVYFKTLSVRKITHSRMNGRQWIMNWTARGRRQSWPNLRHYPGICLGGLRKITINLNRYSRCPASFGPRHLPYTNHNHYTLSLRNLLKRMQWRSSCKVPSIFLRFSPKLESVDNFQQNFRISAFMNNHSGILKAFHV